MAARNIQQRFKYQKQTMMFKKGNKMYSIVNMKCPRCHEGDLFLEANPYKLSKIGKMYPRCPKCNANYTPEPGFYFGAAYVSYFLGVSLCITAYVIMYVLGVKSMNVQIGVIISVIILSAPLLFRLSRSIWANFFIHYRKKK